MAGAKYPKVYVRYLPDDADLECVDEVLLCVRGDEAFRDAKVGDSSVSSSLVDVMIDGDVKEFEETGSPVHALRALVLCDAAGLYPPVAIVRWLAQALYQFHESDGKLDLRELLSLKGSRGKPDVYGRYLREGQRHGRAHTVFLLSEGFGYEVGKAAYMVWAREKACGRTPPEYEWIAEDYSKNWKKTFSRDDLIDLSGEKGAEFIASFPEYSRMG